MNILIKLWSTVECFNQIIFIKKKKKKLFLSLLHTTKKRVYPSIFKTARIAPESARIGSKFLSRRFFSRRFKPPRFECWYRVIELVLALFKSAKKGIRPIQCFWKHRYRPFKLYWFKTYTSAFENARIGSTYSSAFKSAGIGYEWI